MKENPHVSKREMAESIGISTTAIDKNIVALKKKGLLRRIGPARGGHWEVVGKGRGRRAGQEWVIMRERGAVW
ncbi:MAG: HTH domain-containing protein [Euryarchaeota archaeon]|nr:HTH domain-containing protein [Euryarchaeota archaeon]